MELSDETKRKLMDAVIQRERTAFKNRSRSPASAEIRAGIFGQAKELVAAVKGVGQIGWPKVIGGGAIYAAHIRQVDRGRVRRRGHSHLPNRSRKIEGMDKDYA